MKGTGKSIKDGFKRVFSWVPSMNTDDVQYHNRLLCCKIKNPAHVPVVIERLKTMGFDDITTKEKIGQRGSQLMLEHLLNDGINRLHLRMYTIHTTSYFLVHKEPVPSTSPSDLLFHVRGFLERVGHSISDRKEARTLSPDVRVVKHDQRREMSDYEKGCRMFKDITRENTELSKMLDFYPDDQDFLTFSLSFGNVSKLLPVQMLLKDFSSNASSLSNLVELGDNIQSMLHVMGFSSVKKTPITMKLKAIKVMPRFEHVVDIFESRDDGTSEGLWCFATTNYLDRADVELFFEKIAGISKGIAWQVCYVDQVPPLDEKETKKMASNGIHVVFSTLAGFKLFFEHYIASPTSLETIITRITRHPFLTPATIESMSSAGEDQRNLDLIFRILDELSTSWQPVKDVKRRVSEGAIETAIDQAIDFLKNPLFQLVEVDGKRIRRVGNPEEMKLKIARMKRLLTTIDSHY